MTEQWIPKDKAELISAIEHEWKLLMDVVEKLSDEQMTTSDEGGWSPKDNLAHLTEWMKILMEHHMDHRPSHEVLGVPENVADAWDMEVINPVLFERNRNRSRQAVFDELKQVYGRLMTRLTSMTFEDLMRPRHAEDPEKQPLVLWILGDTTDHFSEHRKTIAKAIKF